MKQKCLTMYMTMVMAIPATAQVDVKLAELGMENIRSVTTAEGCVAAYEDRTFRSSCTGVGKALEAALDGMTSGGSLTLAVLDGNGMPQLNITVSRELVESYRNGSCSLETVVAQMDMTTDTDTTMDRLKGTETKKRSAWRPDLTVYPNLFLENTSFDKLYRYSIALAPALEMPLWKWAELTAQVVFPIVGNQKGELKQIRPGVVAVRQGIHLKRNWRMEISAGQFTNHRLGGRLHVNWRDTKGRWEAGARAGLTVHSLFVDREWTLTRKPKADASVYGKVYIPRWNTEVTGEAARFVYGDYGLKGDVTRHFGEYTVGVYALYTEGHLNGGFSFAVPLPGKKYSRWKGMRLKPADYFCYTYGMVAWGEYVDRNLGMEYNTVPGQNRSKGFYQPEYVRYFLLKELRNNK